MIGISYPPLRSPLTPDMVTEMALWVEQMTRIAARLVTGRYRGRNETPMEVVVGFQPRFLYIQKEAVGPSNGVFTLNLQGLAPVSYIPTVGNVDDAVVAFKEKSFSVGANANVNTAGQSYIYFAAG